MKVISCFPARPRLRRYETEPPTDRKAFRLCVDDADRDRLLLDDSKWPDSVVMRWLVHCLVELTQKSEPDRPHR